MKILLSYTHDPPVEDPTGLLVVQVAVADVIVDADGGALEGAACTVQPGGIQALQLPGLHGQRVKKTSATF